MLLKITQDPLKVTVLTALLFTIGCSTLLTKKIGVTDSNSFNELFKLKGGMSITANEFEYAYEKNNFNNDQINNKANIEEYLNLYILFKQKVQAAQSLGMDTTNEFLTEFNSYRESLTNSFINHEDFTDKLIKEAYDRYKEEISAAHILISTPNDTDTLVAYQKIDSIRQLALKGDDFISLATKYSEDPTAAKNGGDLGYFTSMIMVYPFESAAYSTPVGQVSSIVKTKYGYHIIYVKDRRASKGKVSVSHIMIKTTSNDDAEKQKIAHNKIFEIHDQLNSGLAWEQLCQQFSEDDNTKNKAGKLSPFSTGQTYSTFSQAAFDLQEKGQYSDPVKTPFGWHILKLDSILPIESYDKMKPVIKNRVSRDERLVITQQARIKKFKNKNGFIPYASEKDAFDKIDSTLLTGKWVYNTSSEDMLTLFKIGNNNYIRKDAYAYMADQQKPVKGKKLHAYISQLYNEYIEESLLQYERERLAEDNIEYKMLVKEYREGILLFNLMNEKVWRKAVEDTVGINNYFEKNKSKYSWGSRVNAAIYNASSKEIIEEIAILLNQKDSLSSESETLLKKYNVSSDLILNIEQGLFEKQDHEILKSIQWQMGMERINREGRFYLVDVKEVVPSTAKKIEECKGIVISDYQQVLEKNWKKLLEQQHPAIINQDVWTRTLMKLEK